MSDVLEALVAVGGLSAIVITTRAAWILMRRLEPGAQRPRPSDMPTNVDIRLTEIERTTESIAIEIERLGEAQRFTARLLAERLPTPAVAALHHIDTGPLPTRDAGRVRTPH